MPASRVLTVVWAFLAAGLLGLTACALFPPEEMAMAATTMTTAPTTVPPSMRRRRLRRARSARACSSASRRWRAASFCSLREAIGEGGGAPTYHGTGGRDQHIEDRFS